MIFPRISSHICNDMRSNPLSKGVRVYEATLSVQVCNLLSPNVDRMVDANEIFIPQCGDEIEESDTEIPWIQSLLFDVYFNHYDVHGEMVIPITGEKLKTLKEIYESIGEYIADSEKLIAKEETIS